MHLEGKGESCAPLLAQNQMGWEKPVKSVRRTDRVCKNGGQRTGSDALSQDALEATEKHRSRTLSPGKALTAL